MYLEAHSALRYRLDGSLRCSESTFPQTNPQAVDNPGQSNTAYRARMKKGTWCRPKGCRDREIWYRLLQDGLGCWCTCGGPSFGADVRGGSLAP